MTKNQQDLIQAALDEDEVMIGVIYDQMTDQELDDLVDALELLDENI